MNQEVKMISVDEALEYILKHFEPLEPEEVEILDVLGRVLAEGVYSDMEIPPFDNSAMDGYAVWAADGEDVQRSMAGKEVLRCKPTGGFEKEQITSLASANSMVLHAAHVEMAGGLVCGTALRLRREPPASASLDAACGFRIRRLLSSFPCCGHQFARCSNIALGPPNLQPGGVHDVTTRAVTGRQARRRVAYHYSSHNWHFSRRAPWLRGRQSD